MDNSGMPGKCTLQHLLSSGIDAEVAEGAHSSAPTALFESEPQRSSDSRKAFCQTAQHA